MALKTGLAIMAGLLLAGCASRYTPVPLAATFPTTKQAKLQAAYHWEVIANAIEKRLVAELQKSPKRPVFINLSKEPTPFERALAAQLTTSLVNDGYVVSHAPAGSLKIDLDVQAVNFSHDRPQYSSREVPAALPGGVWVMNEIEAPAVPPRSDGLPNFNAYDWFNRQFAPGPVPKTEIIVTVSVSDLYRYLARSTSAYYVADSDRELYGITEPEPEASKLSRTFKVRGDM